MRSIGLARRAKTEFSMLNASLRDEYSVSRRRASENVRVVGFDAIQAQVIQEVGEAHPG